MNLYSRFLSHLLPRSCVLCGFLTAGTSLICKLCIKDLPLLPPHCYKCAQTLARENSVCGTCLSNPPPFERTYALFPYQFPIAQLIVQLKFQHKLVHANALAQLLYQRICNDWYKDQALPDLIIPIPLHRQRLAERGFNQALEIAKPLARALSLPLDLSGITREKQTLAQSGLAAHAREQNIAHAFTAHRSYSGLSIAVLDDVITTGRTMSTCCHLLKQQGAKSIVAWCCARVDKYVTLAIF